MAAERKEPEPKRKKPVGVAWLAVVSRHPFENANTFWAACERGLVLPEGAYLLHTPELAGQAAEVRRWMGAIHSQYLPKERPIEVALKAFDEEDIPSFIRLVEEVFSVEEKVRRRLALDATPTTWGFIPASLALLAREHRGQVERIFYHQYAEASHSDRPYPLVPRKGLLLHDLLEDAHLGEYLVNEKS